MERKKNIHFYADELSFKNLVYTHEAHLVKLNSLMIRNSMLC